MYVALEDSRQRSDCKDVVGFAGRKVDVFLEKHKNDLSFYFPRLSVSEVRAALLFAINNWNKHAVRVPRAYAP